MCESCEGFQPHKCLLPRGKIQLFPVFFCKIRRSSKYLTDRRFFVVIRLKSRGCFLGFASKRQIDSTGFFSFGHKPMLQVWENSYRHSNNKISDFIHLQVERQVLPDLRAEAAHGPGEGQVPRPRPRGHQLQGPPHQYQVVSLLLYKNLYFRNSPSSSHLFLFNNFCPLLIYFWFRKL